MVLPPVADPRAPTGSFSPVLRLLNVHFSGQDPDQAKLQCLETLLRYLENIVSNPGDDKFRRIKLRNAKFAKDVASCPGGESLLIAMGFTRMVKEFEEYLVLPNGCDISGDYHRVKKSRDVMRDAITRDVSAPANKIRAEKEAKELAIRQIEEDARRRRQRQGRERLLGNTLSPGERNVPQSTQNSAAAALRRSEIMNAPIVAASTMLPTPLLTHLKEEDYEHVYEPAEDSFALLDALQNDMTLIRSMAQLPFVLEIGPGTGIVSVFLQQSVLTTSLHLCADISEFACRTTVETSQRNVTGNATSLDVVRTSLTDGLHLPAIDLLIFNPPYVPTDGAEVDASGSIAATWAGGADGMEVTNTLIDRASSLLASDGLFYLVAVARNKPEVILARAEESGLQGRIVLERRAGREKLYIIRFHKATPPPSTDSSSGSNRRDEEVAAILSETRRMDGRSPTYQEDARKIGVVD